MSMAHFQYLDLSISEEKYLQRPNSYRFGSSLT